MASFNPLTWFGSGKHQPVATVRARRLQPEDEVARREARIDHEVDQTFPASDPPSWTLGVSNPDDWR